jgi:hypothetical protein
VLDRRGPDGLTAVDRILQAPAVQDVGEGQVPSDPALPTPLAPPAPEDRATYLALRAAHRSLFHVRSLHPGGARVDDVLNGAQFEVDERRSLPGVQVGDFFETRLVPDPDHPYSLVFSRAMLFHPRSAGPAVLEHANLGRSRREPRAVVLARLQRLRLRSVAYKHVTPLKIYSQKDAPA